MSYLQAFQVTALVLLMLMGITACTTEINSPAAPDALIEGSIDPEMSEATITARALRVREAHLPAGCYHFLAAFISGFCHSSAEVLQALELEYWDRISINSISGMEQWLSKATLYSTRAPIKATQRARIFTLMAMGNVMIYRHNDNIFDPAGLTRVIKAVKLAETARLLDPEFVNLQVITHYLRSYLHFALGNEEGGLQEVQALENITTTYGYPAGTEGELVAANALQLLTSQAHAHRALNILQDCTTPECLRPSALAPFKVIGMQLAVAETYGKVGDLEAMNRMLDEAKALGETLDFPFEGRVESWRNQLASPGGTIDQWNANDQVFGDILLPFPPSTGKYACQTCHYGGGPDRNMYR